jgi:NAD(P)-dependent dehydrogenase (short-subunit alcohol dehydrogenase family)
MTMSGQIQPSSPASACSSAAAPRVLAARRSSVSLPAGARVTTAARTIKEPIDGVEYVQADLTTAEGGEALARAALDRLGGIDILAHVIGGSASPAGGFVALTDETLA